MTARQSFSALGSNPRLWTAAVVALSVVLFVAVNVLANLGLRARLDLTENRLFTLSAGTERVVSGLDEPVTLRFYYSEDLAQDFPAVRGYGRQVQEMLDAFAAESGGLVRVERIDPEPFSPEEDLALAQGLSPAQTPSGEDLYFGLVGTNMVGGRETVPFFAQGRRQFLEYDLADLVYRLDRLEEPVLGIVTNIAMDTGPGGMEAAMRGMAQPLMLYEQLNRRYRIEFLEQDFDAVPDTVDVLMVAHPKPLDRRTLYAIDQFVLRGGPAFVLVDPYSEVAMTPGPTGQPVKNTTATSDLDPLLAAWGIEYDATKVVGDLDNAARVRTGRDSRLPEVSFIPWIGIGRDGLNRQDPVSAEIERINLGTAGHLEPVEGAPTAFLPLVTSSTTSRLLDAARMELLPAPQELLREFEADPNAYVLAARVTGPATTAFPGGQPAETGDEGGTGGRPELRETSPGSHLTEAAEPINVIVLADSDIFDDRFWVQVQNVMGSRVAVPVADNLSFVVNALDNLMGAGELAALRGRTAIERPFVRVEGLRRRAEARFLEEEQALTERLEETERRLAELQGRAGGDGMTAAPDGLSPEELAEMDAARAEILRTRQRLREVQRSLRADIDRLGDTLRFLNIALMPILVALAALGLAWWRRRRRRRRGSVGATA